MKKILLAALLVSGCFFGLVSCDNGKYDATPDIDKSGIPNDLNDIDNPNKVRLGNISFKVDGRQINFSSFEAHAEDTIVKIGSQSFKLLKITGGTGDFRNGEGLQLSIGDYKGPETYIADDSLFWSFIMYFNMTDGKMNAYGPALSAPINMEIEITDDKNGIYTGTFKGILYHSDYPETDEKEYVEITEGKFKLKREPWDPDDLE